MKFRDIFRIEPSTIRVDHAKSWTRSVRGSFEIQVVGLWSSCSDGRHLREFKTEGAEIWNPLYASKEARNQGRRTSPHSCGLKKNWWRKEQDGRSEIIN
jgi:hypothetical protein